MTMLLLACLATSRPALAGGDAVGGAVQGAIGVDGGAPLENDLVEAFRADGPKADYVFVLDTSGTLLPLAEALRPDIAAFVEAAPAGDSIQIVTFHTRASDVLPITAIDDAGRAALAEKIRTLKLTSAQDQDLGAGLSFVTGAVNRKGASDVQFLFVVSNYCHAPSLASDWDSGGRGCRVIRNAASLTSRLQAGRGRRVLDTHLFTASTAARPLVPEGVKQVRGILGPIGALVEETDTFSAWLAKFRANLPLERILPLARSEAATTVLMASVVTEPTQDNPRAVLRLTTGLAHLGLRLDDIQVTGAVPGSSPASVDLVPGGTLELSVVVPPPPFSLLPTQDVVEIPIELHANGKLLPAEGLRANGIDPARPDQSFATSVRVLRHFGLSGPVATAVLFAVFVASGFGAVWVRGKLMPRKLGGSFNYRQGSGAKRPLDISNLGEAAIGVTTTGELAVGRTDKAVLVIRVVRPIWSTYTEVEIRADDVEINTKKAPRGRQRIVPGATSFQFGDFRLTWE